MHPVKGSDLSNSRRVLMPSRSRMSQTVGHCHRTHAHEGCRGLRYLVVGCLLSLDLSLLLLSLLLSLSLLLLSCRCCRSSNGGE